MLDHQFRRFATAGAAEAHFGGDLVGEVGLAPSEAWARQCFAGASFFRPAECELRHEIGVDKIMWGQDYPHVEGTYPYTTEALRHTFAGVDARRGRGHGRRQRGAGSTASTCRRSPPVAARVGPRADEVAEPLDEIPADSVSIAFAGEEVKPW